MSDFRRRFQLHGARFSFTTEVLVKYRRRATSLSASTSNYYQQVIKALRKFQASHHTTPQQRALAETYCRKVEAERNLLLAKQEVLAGNNWIAAQHLLQVLMVRPTLKLKAVLVGLIFFPRFLTRLVQRSITEGKQHACAHWIRRPLIAPRIVNRRHQVSF